MGGDTGVDVPTVDLGDDVVTTDTVSMDRQGQDVVTPPDGDQPDTVTTDVVTPDGETPDVVVKTDGATDAPADAIIVEDGAISDVVTTDAVPTDVVTTDDVIIVEDVPVTDVPVTDVPADGAAMCRASADCATSSDGPVCDTATGRCVPCTTAEDVCAVGNYCNANRCVMGCRNAGDCTGGAHCDTATHACVGCLGDTDCAPGTICQTNRCVPGCSSTRPCGAGSTCCGASCANTQSDNNNCGACGNVCGTGTTCCNGACVNTQTDAANCGMCGAACAVPNATAACTAGRCAVGTCNAGFADCNTTATDGCEVGTSSNASNCGMCGRVCAGAAGASGTCASGTCGITCNDGAGDCDRNTANGCEVNLATSVANCGACGTACTAGANATATCASGACGTACNTGFGNCDGMATNGCEVNLTNAPSNCGACGRVCELAHATAGCAAGACTVGACATGFGNCDAMAANGCETDLSGDRANCGACGRACGAAELCISGGCTRVCAAPRVVCGSTCVDTTTDINNCGRCTNACPATPANGLSACTASACTVTCNRGFGNCDAMVANGCETNLSTSATNCGACGRACTFANASATCAGGACAIGTCNAGFADCDGNPANGCETATAASITNCGACGRVCTFANAAATCAAGACTLGACTTGFANCDGMAANGCETSTAANSLNCGACGRACTAGQACFNGTCVSSCPTGTTFCSGGCVTTQTDVTNCGTCGTRCTAFQTCTAGRCVTPVPSNDRPTGATLLNLATPTLEFTSLTVGANHDLTVSCGGGGGADVFYRFVLTRREYVYADTLAAGYDTILSFATRNTATGAATAITASRTSGDVVCNDDQGTTCTSSNTLTSRVVTVLDPGDYYLVVSGYTTNTGSALVHFEHEPAGSGTLLPLAAGMSTLTGTTMGAGSVNSGTCGGTGPENSYWWITCPGAGAGTLTADTCGTASFDTVLYLNNGNGFTACNDDSCGLQSQLSTMYTANGRLHAFYVDSFQATGGTYTVRVNRP